MGERGRSVARHPRRPAADGDCRLEETSHRADRASSLNQVTGAAKRNARRQLSKRRPTRGRVFAQAAGGPGRAWQNENPVRDDDDEFLCQRDLAEGRGEVFGQGTAGDMWRSMLGEQVSGKWPIRGAWSQAPVRRPRGEPASGAGWRSREGRGRVCRPDERQRLSAPAAAETSPMARSYLPDAKRHEPTAAPSVFPAAAAALPIVRLNETIEAETRDLGQGRPVPYEDYSLTDDQGLLELNRLAPALNGHPRRRLCAPRSLSFTRGSRPIGARWGCSLRPRRRFPRSSPAPFATASRTAPIPRSPGSAPGGMIRALVWRCSLRPPTCSRAESGRGRGDRRSRSPSVRHPSETKAVEARKTHEINVPRIKDGSVKGYAVMLLSYAVDLDAMKKAEMAPDSIFWSTRRFAMSTATIRSISIIWTGSTSRREFQAP